VPSGASFPCRLLEKHPPMFAYAPPRLLTSSFSNERHCHVMHSISADYSLECNQAHLARAHAIRKSSCVRRGVLLGFPEGWCFDSKLRRMKCAT
jgi:hypothetical protein